MLLRSTIAGTESRQRSHGKETARQDEASKAVAHNRRSASSASATDDHNGHSMLSTIHTLTRMRARARSAEMLTSSMVIGSPKSSFVKRPSRNESRAAPFCSNANMVKHVE